MERLLIECLIRSSLIAAAVAVLLAVFRIKDAGTRHAAWSGVLIAMLLLPVWASVGPKFALPLLPAGPGKIVSITAAPSLAQSLPEAPMTAAAPAPANASHAPWNWFAIVWALGAMALLMRLILGTIRAGRLTSETCVAPVTVGWLRPRAILPACAAVWPREKLAIVTAHENEHVRRRDPLIQWLALLNRAIFWFHPLAWWIERHLAGLAEEACDNAVLHRGIDAKSYVDCLLDLAESIGNAAAIAEGAMTMPGSRLPARIREILAGPKPPVSRARLIPFVIAFAIPCALFAAAWWNAKHPSNN